MSNETIQSLKFLSRFGLGLGAFGGLLSIFGVYFLFTAHQSLSWSSVEGSVVAPEIRKYISSRKSTTGSTSNIDVEYYVSLNYTYDVEGTAYFSSRYSLGQGDRVSRKFKERPDAEAEAEESRFQPGTVVTVYYDPQQPTEAVLAPGLNTGSFAPLLMGVFFLGSGWLFYSVGRSKPPLTPGNEL